MQEVVFPVAQNQVGLKGANNFEDLSASFWAHEDGAVIKVEAFNGCAKDVGSSFDFFTANVFDFLECDVGIVVPQRWRFTFFAVSEVIYFNITASIDKAKNRTSGTGAKIGCMGAEYENTSV
jgi:hypothetical protein